MSTRLVYAVGAEIAPNATQFIFGAEQVFRLNSVFDPDQTGAGTQPYGRDTLATIYQRCRVDRATVEMEVIAAGATSGYNMAFLAVVMPSSVATSLTGATYNAWLDTPFSHCVNVSTDGDNERRSWKQDFDIARLEGLTPSQFHGDIDNYSSLVGANPLNVVTLHLALACVNGGTGMNVSFKMRVTYHCTFWNRFILAQS